VTVNAPTPPPPPPPPPYSPPPVPPVVDLTAPSPVAPPPVETWGEIPEVTPPVAPPVDEVAVYTASSTWTDAPPVAAPVGAPVEPAVDHTVPSHWADAAPVAPHPAPPVAPAAPPVAAPVAAPAVDTAADPTAPSLWAEPASEAADASAPKVGGIRDDQLPGRLDVLNLSQWFNKRKVLERCSLSMEPGEVTALIGPSGCGKSTFLRALNRMHELVPGAELAGQVLLNGVDIYGVDMSPTEVRLRIGMVFQKPNPFPAMSIADNVLAGLGLSGSKTDDPEGLVEQCLRRAGLWTEVKDRLGESGMSLSGGQQQRLCIARSLAVHPDVLLMDEPCSALDPISTRVIEETIRELCHDITIVIVTHNMQQAQRVSDQCAFFLVETLGEPGRIVENGPTGRMFSNPSDPRTLDYVNGRFG
jgi:phosphate transport system ATP-binding protein